MSIEPAEEELWIRYRMNGDIQARDFLFMRYTSWARSVASSVYRRFRTDQVEWADYVQNAQVGLLEAMSRFDVVRGHDFMGYAKPRVRGAVFNGLRIIFKEGERRTHTNDRQDRLSSLNEDRQEDLLSGFVDSIIGLGIGYLLESESFGVTQGAAHGMVERAELGFLLKDALLDLKERERRVLIAHYFQQVPFIEIATRMGVTKGRVSQIHKAALMSLRLILSERRLDFESM